jgi:hypothetical protein
MFSGYTFSLLYKEIKFQQASCTRCNMDMCTSFWLFNSNPEAMCCKCLIETLTELMSKLGIVEESSKPSLAYLPRKKFLTDSTLYSNAAPSWNLSFFQAFQHILPPLLVFQCALGASYFLALHLPLKLPSLFLHLPLHNLVLLIGFFCPQPPSLANFTSPPPPSVSFYNSESVYIILC